MEVITWNVAGAPPPADCFIASEAHILVLGLQEIVKLNPQNVIVLSNGTAIQQWVQWL
jgi:hypothetical protein